MILIGWLPSLAHDFEVDGVFYNKTSDNAVAVTYKGNYADNYSNEYAGDVVIPSSVDYNGITYSVTSIGDDAFNRCSSLTGIKIPNSVTSIGYNAFYDCSSLTSIQIPNSVTSIGNWAFAYCSSLTSIVVDACNTKYDSRNECNAIIETASNTLIAGCQNTIIPNSVTSIGNFAFSGCSSLTGIQIPNSVTSIGDSAFAWCESLTSVVIGKSVTSIGDRAFYNCESLTSAVIGNTVTSIGDRAFDGCKSLTSIEIPNSVTSIGYDAFSGCSRLTEITCWATTPPTITYNTFSNYYADLYVPAGCKSAYQSANHWKKFYYIKEIPTLSTSIALNQTTATLEVTETITLIATILPENATDKSVEWSSSDETVAVVDENGVVTAISIGEAVITATTADGSNLSASCKVTVAPTLAVSIELDQTEASVEEKSEFQLTATILPEHTTNKEVAWSSSDKWVASVDNTGLVIMYSAGEVIITATTTDGTNLSATCHINVYSGIDGVEGDDVIVATVGDNIVVKNAQLGSVVNVYASNGAMIASEVATEGDVIIEAPVKGVYVVKVGKQTVKVII